MKFTFVFLLAIPFLHSALALMFDIGPYHLAPQWVRDHINDVCKDSDYGSTRTTESSTTYKCSKGGKHLQGNHNHDSGIGTHNTQNQDGTEETYFTKKGERNVVVGSWK